MVKYVVESRVREYMKSHEKNVSSGFFEGLNKCVEGLLQLAILRSDGNGRRTVRGCDL